MSNSNKGQACTANSLGLKPVTSAHRLAQEWVHKVFSAPKPETIIDRDISCLPGKVRKNILLQLMKTKCLKYDQSAKYFHSIIKPALQMLLDQHDSELTALDLTGFVSSIPNNKTFNFFLQAISALPNYALTNLQAFTVLGDRCLSNRMINEPFRNAFIGMANLEVLRIEVFSVALSDLLHWCESRLQNLRLLSVSIYKEFDLPTDEALAKSFPRLRAFFFRTEAPKELSAALKRLCWESLPNLQVARDFASDFCSQLNYEYAPHQTDASNLRHMDLDLDYETAQEDVHLLFPHVTHLKIHSSATLPVSDERLERLLRFSNIESLHLSLVSPKVVNQYVESYGPNLHSLFLEDYAVQLRYNRIFSLCPSLERLAIFTFDPEKKIVGHEHLKELRLKSSLVSNILFAPNLEKVTLHNRHMSLEDLKAATDSICSGRMIPRKLECLEINMRCLSLAEVDQLYFEAVADFLKAIDRFVPTVNGLKLNLNDNCDYLAVVKSLIDRRLTNEDVPELSVFFLGVLGKTTSYHWFVDTVLVHVLKKYV